MAFTFSWGLKIPVTTAKDTEKRIAKKTHRRNDNFFIINKSFQQNDYKKLASNKTAIDPEDPSLEKRGRGRFYELWQQPFALELWP